jgi:hypothetical protein
MYTSAQNSTKYGFELREYLKTAEVNENVPQIERIELFNVAGKLVWNEKIQQSGQQFSLNLSLIIKGIYFLKAYSSKGTIPKKLLIE